MNLKHYETTVILKPEGGMDTIKQFAERVDGIVNEMGGKILTLQSWGEKKLAYEIKKNMKGSYLFFDIVADGSLVKELERNFNIWEHVLKYMSIKVDEKKPVSELVEGARGIGSLFEKPAEKKLEESVKSVKETVETEVQDSKEYNEKLQESLSKSKEDEDDNVEL